tara:strand:+ start:99 stop:1052 length:954 start_codon:yes stop_codon:yes gene_type:complete
MKSGRENFTDGEIDILDLFRKIWSEKIIVLSVTAVFCLFALTYSLSLPNLYVSKSLLYPNENTSNSTSSFGQYSSLAGLAGISLPPAAPNKTKESIEILKSLEFFKKSILPNIFLPDLLAVKSWNPQLDKLEYDNSIYDEKSAKWTRKNLDSNTSMPSVQESFEVFSEHFNLAEDISTGFITLSIKHQSPHIAEAWLNSIIYLINSTRRLEDKLKIESNIDYLNTQLSSTNYAEIKSGLSELLQSKIKALMMINSETEYVFKVIDPPYIPEKKSEPRRFLIIMSGIFFGFLFGSSSVLLGLSKIVRRKFSNLAKDRI